MGYKNLGGFETADGVLNIGEDVLALVGPPGVQGAGIRHRRHSRQHAPEWWIVAPVRVPDMERAEIGITQEREIVGRKPQYSISGHRLLVPNDAHAEDRRRPQHRMMPVNHEGPLVVVPVRQENDMNRDVLLHGLLDDTTRGDYLVVRVRGKNQDAILGRQRDFRPLGPGGRQASAQQQHGEQGAAKDSHDFDRTGLQHDEAKYVVRTWKLQTSV